MAYKAIIQHVEKTEDEITVAIEYTNGVKTYSKRYPLVHVVDIETGFDQTIQMELKRINDLETGYATLKIREGEEILQIIEVKS